MIDDLNRFLMAQERDYAQALAEIRAGRKQSHWIWYIFPQLRGLGYSYNAEYYVIADTGEARLYLAHPVLGARLREITNALLNLPESDPVRVMGRPDDLKLCSSMTLFEYVAEQDSVFGKVLDKYYGGRRDAATLRMV